MTVKHNGLKRTLGLFPVTSIVVANMIGAGIFTTSGLLMSGLGSPVLMITLWIAGGIIALCGALSYSDLGTAMPEAGGEYIFLSRLYHPLLGFLSGWVSFIVGFSAPIAASAMGVSEYLSRAFPEMSQHLQQVSPIFAAPEKIVSVLVILLFTGIHLRGIRAGARVQNVLTLLKVIMILLLIIAGFAAGKGNMAHLGEGSNLMAGFGGWKTMGLSLMWIMFAYSGWNASTYIGSEIRDPRRNLPASLLLGTGVVMVLYVGLNLLYVYALPPSEMEGVISVGGLAAGKLFGRQMETAFSLMIGFALFSSLSAYMIIGPRLYFSMAREGYFFAFLGKVNKSGRAPANAIVLQAVFSVIMVLSGSFEQILTYMGFALGLFPIVAVAGVFRLQSKKRKLHPGFPFTSGFYILSGIGMLLLSYIERPVESSVALATVIAGIPVYFIFRIQIQRRRIHLH